MAGHDPWEARRAGNQNRKLLGLCAFHAAFLLCAAELRYRLLLIVAIILAAFTVLFIVLERMRRR